MHALAVTEQGAALHAEGETLVLLRGERRMRQVRLQDVDEVLLFGRVEITSGAIAALARRGVNLVFLTAAGNFRARLTGRGSKNVALRLTQYARTTDLEFAARVARAIVAAKIVHQRALLLRAQRRLQDDALAETLGRMRLLAERAERETDLEVVRGLEGQAAALYFSQFGKALQTPELPFEGRTRRPPKDPVNACLSFGYALLGTIVETEVLRCGLDPMLGFLHRPDYGRPSLMLDLLEEMRPIVDALTLRLINRRQLGPADFVRRGDESVEEILAGGGDAATARGAGLPGGASVGVAAGDRVETAPSVPAPAASAEGVYLGDTGRKIYLAEFFRRLRERLFYPPREGVFELRDILREQVYHMARVIEGKEADYRPFVPK